MGLIAIFVLVLSGNVFAMDNDIEKLSKMDPYLDPIKFIRQVHKTYRKVEKEKSAPANPEYVEFLQRERRDRIDEATVCADCPNLLLLTEQVNGILQHVRDDPKNNLPGSILNEIDSLEGMFYFVQEESKHTVSTEGSTNCKRWEMSRKNPFDRPDDFNHENHIMLFTKKISFENISQAQFIEPGVKKTYFFRGAHPHKDIVIKVTRDSEGNSEVTYYQHRKIALEAIALKEQQDLQQKVIRPLSGEDQNEANASKEGGPIVLKNEVNGKKDELKLDYGWNKEGDGVIPDKVTVLKVEGISEFDSMKLTGGAEVSSKRQAADIKVQSNDGKDYVGVEVNAKSELKLESRSEFETFAVTGQAKVKMNAKSGAVQLRDKDNAEIAEVSLGEDGLTRLGIPHKFNVYDTGVVVDGKVIAGQDGSYGGTWVLSDRDSNTQYGAVGVQRDENRTSFSAGHSRSLSESSSISIKLQHDLNVHSRDTSSGWVQFSMSF